MTNSQMIYFMTVAQCLSFSKAANQLYVSQPAVSRQIAQLEDELNFPLFDRTRKEIILTHAGQLIYDYFIRSNADLEDTIKKAKEASCDHVGTISIGCVEGWDLSEFYPIINQFFRDSYPNIELVFDGYSFHEMVPALKRREVDIIITLDAALADHGDLVTRHLTTAESILLFSSQHPAAGKSDLNLSDFKDETFLTVSVGNDTRLHKTIRKQCELCGFIPKIISFPKLSTAFMKVQSGTGVLLASDWMMVKNNPLFSYIPLNFTRDVTIAWLKGDKKPIKNLFINELLFHYKQIT